MFFDEPVENYPKKVAAVIQRVLATANVKTSVPEPVEEPGPYYIDFEEIDRQTELFHLANALADAFMRADFEGRIPGGPAYPSEEIY